MKIVLYVQFAGHGERNAISFETKYAEIYAMDVKTLKSLLEISQTSSRTKIVVVSACHSEEAGRTFIEAGMGENFDNISMFCVYNSDLDTVWYSLL